MRIINDNIPRYMVDAHSYYAEFVAQWKGHPVLCWENALTWAQLVIILELYKALVPIKVHVFRCWYNGYLFQLKLNDTIYSYGNVNLMGSFIQCNCCCLLAVTLFVFQ